METIEISDGVVHLVEREVTKSITLEAFKDSLRATLGFKSPILPSNTIFYGQLEACRVYAIEQAPCVRTINYRPDKNRNSETFQYTIPLPWVYLIVTFHEFALESLHVYFRGQRVKIADDVLYVAPLPNIHGDGLVCLGDLRFEITSPMEERVEKLKRLFWDSVFNADILYSYDENMPEAIEERSGEDESFAGWERISTEEAG